MTLSIYQERQQQIIRIMAMKAYKQPLLESKLWFHNDIRDNFYYASYLYAASVTPELAVPMDRSAAQATAVTVLLELLALQDQEPQSPTYGHWPLSLNPSPREAKPHVLPVELMGSLMVYFCHKYAHTFQEPLRTAFESALRHVYESPFYRVPLEHYHHHEAKYTATKLIMGQKYKDQALLEDGHRCLRDTIARVTTKGMTEYGCLPWFWHWVQAFTCAWELADDPAIKADLSELLDFLWGERAQFYLKGTWVGAHSRGWPHDIPQDRYVAHDYVQFGDFSLPDIMPRIEYAGFLFYKAPEAACRVALDRSQPTEVKKSIPSSSKTPDTRLHSYTYITESFAAGGIWERVTEFDNEQHRFDVTLPLTGQAGINKAYFFHPGDYYRDGDPRHQSEHAEVLFHNNVIMAVYPIPETANKQIIGVLPLGTWLQEPKAIFGYVNDVYMAIYLMQTYSMREEQDRYVVTSEGTPNGVVFEVMARAEAEITGIQSVEAFAAFMKDKAPVYSSGAPLQVSYRNLKGEQLELIVDSAGRPTAMLNGATINFGDYVK